MGSTVDYPLWFLQSFVLNDGGVNREQIVQIEQIALKGGFSSGRLGVPLAGGRGCYVYLNRIKGVDETDSAKSDRCGIFRNGKMIMISVQCCKNCRKTL